MKPQTIWIALLLPCLLGVSGCSFKTKWRDTTNQGRVQELAQADARICADASGYAALNEHHSVAELEAFKGKLDACMSLRGWKLVRDTG